MRVNQGRARVVIEGVKSEIAGGRFLTAPEPFPNTAPVTGAIEYWSREEVIAILDTYLLEKAVYELSYELNNRPDWVKLPLQGIWQMLKARE